MDVHYRDRKVGSKRVDFIVEQVMVEIKAKSVLEGVDFVQTFSEDYSGKKKQQTRKTHFIEMLTPTGMYPAMNLRRIILHNG